MNTSENNKLKHYSFRQYKVLEWGSFLYRQGLNFHRNLYKHRVFNSIHISKPVLSIGNIISGGSGKTPFTVYLAEGLKKRGFSPAIICRSYKAKNKYPKILCNSEFVDPTEVGDEAALMAWHLQDLPIITARSKSKAAIFAESVLEIDCILIDDGFQHWALSRDLDLVLIKNWNSMQKESLLPLGLLREPFSALKRADALVLIDLSEAEKEDLEEKLQAINFGKNIFQASFEAVDLLTLPEEKSISLNTLASVPLLAFCGLANPYSFKETLTNLNFDIKEFIAFKDHHNYKQQEFKKLLEKAKDKRLKVITTTKDAVKVKKFLAYNACGATAESDIIYVLKTKVVVFKEEFFWNWFLSYIAKT